MNNQLLPRAKYYRWPVIDVPRAWEEKLGEFL